jgi:hypothetical protein
MLIKLKSNIHSFHKRFFRKKQEAAKQKKSRADLSDTGIINDQMPSMND